MMIKLIFRCLHDLIIGKLPFQMADIVSELNFQKLNLLEFPKEVSIYEDCSELLKNVNIWSKRKNSLGHLFVNGLFIIILNSCLF